MRRSRAQLKAELRADAHMLMDELLDWMESTPAPTLTQIEDVVLELRKRLGERITQVVLKSQEPAQPVLQVKCPTGGWEMRRKGKKRVGLERRNRLG